jgi:hypothetical protein
MGEQEAAVLHEQARSIRPNQGQKQQQEEGGQEAVEGKHQVKTISKDKSEFED